MPRPAFLAGMICLLLQSFLLAEEPVTYTAVMNMGLHGPVHSQRATSKKLNPDPRPDPKIFIVTPNAWVEFDTAGRIIEESSAAKGDGTIISLSRTSYDPKTGSESNYDGNSFWRSETQVAGLGRVDVKTFRNDVLFSRESKRYDERGNVVEVTTSNAAGEVQSRATYAYDEQGRNVDCEVWGFHDQFSFHMADRYDQDGDLVQRTYFNENGRAMTTFSLTGGRLTSYWQAADCSCSNTVGISFDDVSYDYKTEPDGTLETTIQNHPKTRSNIELTDTERFSNNNTLVEKVAFSYERDAWGNWTKRIVSAWDSNNDTMIPIKEDLRTLTYY